MHDHIGGLARAWDMSGDTFNRFGFRVYLAGIHSVRVEHADWARRGYVIALTTDPELEYKTLDTLTEANETYHIYVELTSIAGRHPGLVPDTLSAHATTELEWIEIERDFANTVWPIATVTTNADGKIKTINQNWWGGEINDVAVVPDTNSVLGGHRNTLEFCPAGGYHEGELQLTDVDTVSENLWAYPVYDQENLLLKWAAPDAKDFGLLDGGLNLSLDIGVSGSGRLVSQLYNFANASGYYSGAGALILMAFQRVPGYPAQGHMLKYIPSTDYIAEIGEHITIDYSQIDPMVPHSELNFNVGAGIEDAGQVNYNHAYVHPVLGGDNTKVAFAQIGFATTLRPWDTTPPMRIDLDTCRLIRGPWPGAGGWQLDWNDGKLALGGHTVTLTWGSVTPALSGYDWSIAADIHLLSASAHAGTETGTGAIQLQGGWSSVGSNFSGGNMIVASDSVFQHGANLGVTLSDIFSGGLLVNAGLVLKKIRVIDVDTDDTIELDVLGVIT